MRAEDGEIGAAMSLPLSGLGGGGAKVSAVRLEGNRSAFGGARCVCEGYSQRVWRALAVCTEDTLSVFRQCIWWYLKCI